MDDKELLDVLKYMINQEYHRYLGFCCKANYGDNEFISALHKVIKKPRPQRKYDLEGNRIEE